jgi:putative oxidoreductase
MALLSSLSKYRDTGLLILRVGLGICFIMHGYPKLAGGEQMWGKVGGAMSMLHIDFGHSLWGLLAAVAETLGGLLLILGFLFRPACVFLTITMIVAAAAHLTKGEGFNGASHAMELAIITFSLLFIGPGKYSADKK